MHCLNKIQSIVLESDTPHTYVLGDFNANLKCDSTFGEELQDLCHNNSFCISDKMFLPSDTFTHISNAHGSTSWLDHCVTTSIGHNIISNVNILQCLFI